MAETNQDTGFDDGLVHCHAWASEPARARENDYPIADTSRLRTPSTVHHDEHIFCA